MLEMKRERMSVFIGNARAEIERLWDDLMWSEEEREAFTAFHDGKSSGYGISILILTHIFS